MILVVGLCMWFVVFVIFLVIEVVVFGLMMRSFMFCLLCFVVVVVYGDDDVECVVDDDEGEECGQCVQCIEYWCCYIGCYVVDFEWQCIVGVGCY